MLELLKNQKFSIFFSVLMLALCAASFYFDAFYANETYWFQRSGALIVLAGVELQYSRMTSIWKNHNNIRSLPNSAFDPAIPDSVKKIRGISLVEEHALELSELNHKLITSKSFKDSLAVIVIITGTGIWAYGDLPFKIQSVC